MRVSKKERKENAKSFYQQFMNGYSTKTAIVVNRQDSKNPNIARCQFLAVPGSVASGTPVVIAESVWGVEGCFMELLENIKLCPQKTYYENGFDDWLKETFGFEITYKDGFVFMLERE